MRYKTYVTHKQDILSVYCLHVILFDFFFITLMLVYLQKLLNCLIIYSYNTNPSFSLCPWNLRSIGPSDFKDRQWLVSNFFISKIFVLEIKIIWIQCIFLKKAFNVDAQLQVMLTPQRYICIDNNTTCQSKWNNVGRLDWQLQTWLLSLS